MVRWSQRKEGVVLSGLFDNGVADPRFCKAGEIDPIKEMDDMFAEFSAKSFRDNYKTTATAWMAGKASEGMRKKMLDKKKEEEDTNNNNNDIDDHNDDDDDDGDDNDDNDNDHTSTYEVEEEEDLKPAATMKKAPPQKQRVLQSTPTTNIVYTPDGRILCAVQCTPNWKGDIFVTPDCKAVHQTTLYKYTIYCNASLHLRAFGVDHRNHVFQSVMQVEKEKMWKRFQSNTSNELDVISVVAQGNPDFPDLLVTRKVCDLAFQVEYKYYDLNDNEQRDVCVDRLPGSGDWVTLVLKKRVDLKSPELPQQRRRGGQRGAGTTRERPDDINTSQQQDQQSRNHAVNTNNNSNNNNTDTNMVYDSSAFSTPRNEGDGTGTFSNNFAVAKTTDSSTSVVTHTSSLAAAAAASNKQAIIKMIPNLTTRRQEQHSYSVETVKEEPFFESPIESISSSSLDPINTIETNMKEIDSYVFGE